MDGYLAKPVNAAALLAIIASFTEPPAVVEVLPAPPAAAVRSAEREESALDLADVLERVDGDRGLLRDLAKLFRDEAPRMVADIRRCVDSHDASGLQRAAHQFKGACANMGARPMARVAHALETIGRSEQLSGATLRCVELELEAQRVDLVLATMEDE
ncbi:MAG: Hpt domain-containing protein [Gemmatimonadaceae bacterium]